MVSAHTVESGNEEGPVGVMRWFVQDLELRWSFVGSPEVDAVAFGAVLFVELLACG